MGQASAMSPLAAHARMIKRHRAELSSHFPPKLFADPNLEILLDLFIAWEEGKRLQVSTVCIGACVPPTTALRNIETLVTLGLVERSACEKDGRRTYVELTEDGHSRLQAWLKAGDTMANAGQLVGSAIL